MATQIIERLIDDLDGGDATETVTFAYDGVTYSIDLSAKNAARLRKALKPFTDKGAKAAPGRRRPTAADSETTEGRARIRAWARGHMFGQFPNLGDRGRIPHEIVAAYNRAHGYGR